VSVTNEQPKSGEASGSAHDVPFELIAKYDRPGPRYTSYPTAPEWRDLAAAEAGAAYARLGGQAGRISVYVHVPFCERMCLFCGCNVVAGRSRERVPRYVKALLREIDKVRELAGAKQTVQLHFGGGTPTFLLPRSWWLSPRAFSRRFPETATPRSASRSTR